MTRLRRFFAVTALAFSLLGGIVATAAPSAALPDPGVSVGCETAAVSIACHADVTT